MGALMVHSAAWAQSYPDRSVKIMLGYAPGGTADFFARVVAHKLSNIFSQPFVIDNKPGAIGNIATAQVARAPADGYKFLFGNMAEIAVKRYLMPNNGLIPEKDLAPVAAINDVPLVLVVAANSSYKTLADIVADGKSLTQIFHLPLLEQAALAT